MQEPIAIVGYSLKFPGEATSPAAFWRMLEEKRCAVNKIPKDRFSASGSYHPDGGRHGVVSHICRREGHCGLQSLRSILLKEAISSRKM